MTIRQTSNSPRLPEKTTTERNVIYTRTMVLIPPGDDDSSTQLVFVLVAHLFHYSGSGQNGGWCTHGLTRITLNHTDERDSEKRTFASGDNSARNLRWLVCLLQNPTYSSIYDHGGMSIYL